MQEAEIAAFVISMAFIVFLYDRLKSVLTRSINILLPDRVIEYQKFIKNLSDSLITIKDINKLSEVLVRAVYDFYELMSASVMIYNNSKGIYLISYACGESSSRMSLNKENNLVKFLGKHGNIVDRGIYADKNLDDGVREALEEFNADICIPLFFENKLTGIILLGRKKGGKNFTPEDIDSFNVLGKQVSIAFKDAFIYKEQLKMYMLISQKNKMDALMAISGGIQHEINNPLNIINIRCQNFLRKYSSGGFISESDIIRSAHDVIESNLRNANRAYGITKRLASFAQPKQDKINLEPLQIVGCINECIDLVGRAKFLKDNIGIFLDISDEFGYVYADKVQFQQIIYNIVTNACHAIRQNGTITFKTYEYGNSKIVLEIQDTGCGIRAEDFDKIWEPYYTTKTSNEALGENVCNSGLGLSLVKRYIENIGGTVNVKSIVGRGTTFYFNLIKAVGKDIEKLVA